MPNNPAEIPLEIHDLTVAYHKKPVLYGIDAEIPKGKLVGIVGPNGAGKSTLIKAIMGLVPASSGWIKIFGKPYKQNLTRVGYVPQRESVDWDFPVNVMDVVLMGRYGRLGMIRRPGAADRELARECLDKVQMLPFANRQIGNLSGGQQQRLFVALAVVNAPRLVFFDEMTTGLDPMSRRVTWDLVRQVRDQGTTVVLVTHFMDEAEELCDRIAVINEKRVVAIDTPLGLVERFGGGATVTFSTDAADLAFLDRVEEVDGVNRQGRRVTVTGHGAFLVSVAAAVVAHGLKPIDLASHQASLEDVFLTITGEER